MGMFNNNGLMDVVVAFNDNSCKTYTKLKNFEIAGTYVKLQGSDGITGTLIPMTSIKYLDVKKS